MKQLDIQIQHEHGKSDKSKLRQYQDLVVGSHSFAFLLLFEGLILSVSRLGGSLGLLLRSLFYPLILKKIGRKVIIAEKVVLRHPKKISIGSDSRIGHSVLLDAKGMSNSGITIGAGCVIGVHTVLSCKEGDIIIGDNVTIADHCNISSNAEIVIGGGTTIERKTHIFATSHTFDSIEKSILDQGWSAVGIKIGDDVKIGENVVVVDEVTLGEGVVVDDSAVVTQSFSAGARITGAPARVVRAD